MRLLSVMFMMIACISVNAQDIIVKTNGDEIKAKVEEVSENAIKYRNASNPTGPLYTISRSSVASILYENGYMDKFYTADDHSIEIVTNSDKVNNVSDEDLLKMAGINNEQNGSDTMSDHDLTRLYNKNLYGDKAISFEDQIRKAQRYKRIGWIGGSIMALAGIGVGLGVGLGDEMYYNGPVVLLSTLLGGVVGGAVWCVSFNLAANNIIKSAKTQQLYSATLLESEVFNCGQNTRLFAGVDLMTNRMTNERTLGLGLKLNF